MTIRGLTLRQPWASLIACGAKKYETRSRKLIATIQPDTYWAIHAGLQEAWPERDYARGKIKRAFGFHFTERVTLPAGAILCVVRPVEIIATSGHIPSRAGRNEYWFGDWSLGRFAIKVERVMICMPPIPCRGAQGLWKLPPQVESFLLDNLSNARRSSGGAA